MLHSLSLHGQMRDFKLVVDSPVGLSVRYDAFGASFGPGFCELDSLAVRGAVVLADNGFGVSTSCDMDGPNVVDATDKIIIVDRGICGFVEKVLNVLPANPLAVVICSDDRNPTNPGGTDPGNIPIPSFMINKEDCDTLKAYIDSGLEISIYEDFRYLVAENEIGDDEVFFYENFQNGLDGWDNVGLFSDSQNVEASDAIWAYTAEGVAPTCFASGKFYHTGACDGAAIYDFQSYSTNNCTNGDLLIKYFSGELISPTIDLSDAAIVKLNFVQYFLNLNDASFVSYSLDDGLTWKDTIPITTENVLHVDEMDIIGAEALEIVIPELAGVSTAKIKFVADGDLFFWMIDDVYVTDIKTPNAALLTIDTQITTQNIPSLHADAYPLYFDATIRNYGGVALLDGMAIVSIKDEIGTVVHTDQLLIDSLYIGEERAIRINSSNPYTANDLQAGKYTVTISLDYTDYVESSLDDNSQSFVFFISDNYWDKTDSLNGYHSYILPGHTDDTIVVAAMYKTSPSMTADQAYKIEFSLESRETSLEGNYVDVYLLSYTEGSAYPFNQGSDFERTTLKLDQHKDLQVLYKTRALLDNTNFSGDKITVDLVFRDDGSDPVNNPILLEGTKEYLVAILLEDYRSPITNENNLDLEIGCDLTTEGQEIYIANKRNESPFWFTTTDEFTPAPFIRLYRRMISNTNTPQLPEGAFTVYPNPATDMLTLEIALSDATNATLDIAGIDGKIISSKLYNNVQSDTKQIGVANLPNGTYIVRLATEKGSTIHKVVVQH